MTPKPFLYMLKLKLEVAFPLVFKKCSQGMRAETAETLCVFIWPFGQVCREADPL